MSRLTQGLQPGFLWVKTVGAGMSAVVLKHPEVTGNSEEFKKMVPILLCPQILAYDEPRTWWNWLGFK